MTRKEEIEQAKRRNKFANFDRQVAYEFGFQQGAEWADKTMIDKACEILESLNIDYYQIREGVFSKQLVEDFRKLLEG